MSERIPVLLDTDIGSDIDDAVCLAYLLAQPRCELLGITTVSGQPLKRAMLADAICRAAGRSNVPVHSGCSQPVLHTQRQPEAPQAEVLGHWQHREDFAPSAAVEFLRQMIRSRPGELTLLTIGPTTNAGLLCALDPEAVSLLKRIVMMAGQFFTGGLKEWNIVCDPYAAQMVFSSPAPEIVAYGLDVTRQCQLSADECRQRMQGKSFEVVQNMAEVWFRRQEKITFHDPLAAVCIFEPDICSYEDGMVVVDLEPGENFGRTLFEPKKGGVHRVASQVDSDRFFEHYFGVTSA